MTPLPAPGARRAGDGPATRGPEEEPMAARTSAPTVERAA
ncbi:hypothetical protein Ae168Ps1_1534c [Pseudonocardia sp. Ae168_Ps1]|nr:hypothetical protein Ae150APs1_1529c [Pseudonocardia sp. Ae150A_Ps1]OLL79128.1 hypothetical protein Ae168Ps1_1534c [Pseudonocardia sp. Ae168_Ps1]OLL86735.1 hypothetical protein Ae263Ps1_3790 [Pseudonocardia sp. Ae263_Ps1]OLL93220.1 hypothetical protein Ae356Ps1_3117c [Pseudonocardia sp. Ae356_Ps1]